MKGRKPSLGYLGPVGLCIFLFLAAWAPALAFDGLPVTPYLHISSSDRQDVGPGLALIRILGESAEGPVRISVVEAKSGYSWDLAPLLASGNGRGLATVWDMSARANAAAAINGGFFSQLGAPLGLYISEGVLYSPSIYDRGAIAIGYDGRYAISRMKSVMIVSGPDGRTMRIDGVNRPFSDSGSEAVLFTANNGTMAIPAPPTNRNCIRIVIRDGMIKSLEKNGDPPQTEVGDSVLMAIGEASERIGDWNLAEGSALNFGYAVALVKGADGIVSDSLLFPKSAVGGGPLLLTEGRPVEYGSERFQSDVVLGRAPRTALGVRPSGDLLFAVADGRNPGVSIGLTLSELTELFLELGCDSALNLDGGGSSTLVVNNEVVNMPSDGLPRKVSNAIALFRKEPGHAEP